MKVMTELVLSNSSSSDDTALKLNLLNTKTKLNKALLEHYAFRPRHRELLELSREFEKLKDEVQMLNISRMEIVPQLSYNSLPAVTSDDEPTLNRGLSASGNHAQVVAELQEALDMHSSCVYLLKLHQAISSLETAVTQLRQCVQKRSPWDVDELHEDTDEDGKLSGEDEGDPLCPVTRVTGAEDVGGNGTFVASDDENIDADIYRLCTDAVLTTLEEAETRFAQSTKFSKDNVSIFQGFRRTLVRCKTRLAEHVDMLWRRWIVLRPFKPAKSLSSTTGLSPELLSQLHLTSPNDPLGFLCTSTLPTTAEMATMMKNSHANEYSSFEMGVSVPSERGSAVLASLTVYARPELLVQLFRLSDALNDSKARFEELSMQINQNLLVPWLTKVPCTESSEKFWPTLETRLIEADSAAGLLDDAQYGGGGLKKSPSRLTPVWQLELISPATAGDEEEQLILDSCRQLSTVFQQLSTYLFGLTIRTDDETDRENHKEEASLDGDKRQVPQSGTIRVIDLAMKAGCASSYFDNSLVVPLIDGRFTAGLPSADKCNRATFLAPVTQTVYRLAVEGQTTGFLTGTSLDDRQAESSSSHIVPSGGASLLLHWLNNLSGLTQQTHINEVIDQVRKVLCDREQLRTTRVVGDRTCSKPGVCMEDNPFVDDDENEIKSQEVLERGAEEFQIYRKHELREANDANKEKPSYFIPSLSQLLESEVSRENLSRFLDLGHFHFPLSRVSLTVLTLLEYISAVTNETQSLLSQKVHQNSQLRSTESATSIQPEAIRTNASTLIESLIELVPRLVLLFTSIIPVFHSTLLDSDLYVTALYHNSCMFLAHECLTMGELRLLPLLAQMERSESRILNKDGDQGAIDEDDLAASELALLRRAVSVSTVILVPQLRAAGTDALLTHIRRYRDSLNDHLKQTKGLKDIGLSENRERCTQAIEACQTTLISVAEGLSPLPLTMFSRCMGYLCNFVCTEVVRDVLSLLDLTRADCEVLVNLLNELEHTVTHIFSAPPDVELSLNKAQEEMFINSLARRVPELIRLRGILSILTAPTMAVIEHELWNGGHGPLVTEAHLEPSELRGLVLALYSKSTARDQLLRHLR